mmetsp:Transcript_5447/g.10380  ORF Transcript_5447/g.10380 Transcript_5447/m.10380 type:complete len:86 (-) Transcript_5447:28-285(-)
MRRRGKKASGGPARSEGKFRLMMIRRKAVNGLIGQILLAWSGRSSRTGPSKASSISVRASKAGPVPGDGQAPPAMKSFELTAVGI